MDDEKNSRLIAQVKSWAEKDIDGISLKKTISYDNVSFWWFIEPIIFDMLKRGTNEKIKFSDRILIKVLDVFILLRFALRFLFSRILFNDKMFDSASRLKVLAISYSTNWRNILDSDTLKVKTGDLMLDSVITELVHKDCSVLGLQSGSRYYVNLKKLFELRFSNQTIWLPIERYLSIGLIFESLKLERRLIRNFDDNFSFLENKSIKSEIKKYLIFRIIQMFLFIEILKKIIDSKKPDTILITAEEGSLGRAAVFAGKLKDIPTVAVLHGVISKINLCYYHIPNEIARDKDLIAKCPVPDKTMTFGEYFNEILIKECNYPSDFVVATGQPRYDILSKFDEIYAKKEFCKKYGLNYDKKIILILDESPLDFLTINLDELRKLENIEIVIKPHPVWSDVKVESKIAEKLKAKITILDKNSVIYEALNAADLVITLTSTSLLESLILGKPTLITNYTNQEDITEYEKNKATICIYDSEELLPIIKKIFGEEKFKKQMFEMNDLFLKRYCISDGSSSHRVVDEMFKLAKKR